MAPVEPVDPIAPASPTGPVAPANPVAPAGPAIPSSPLVPFSPLVPAGPAGPVDPVSPVAPVLPVIPCGPCDPTTPAGPAGPIAPGDVCRGKTHVVLPDIEQASAGGQAGRPGCDESLIRIIIGASEDHSAALSYQGALAKLSQLNGQVGASADRDANDLVCRARC